MLVPLAVPVAGCEATSTTASHCKQMHCDGGDSPVYSQAAKAFKEAVAGFTLRIQQLAALWVRLLETLDRAGMLPIQPEIAGQTTSIPQPEAASVPVQAPGMAITLPTAAALAGPNWLPAFHTLLQESSAALKVCVCAVQTHTIT